MKSTVKHGAVIQTEAGFDPAGGYGGITVLADGVTIDGFKIVQGVGNGIINTHDSDDVTIKNNLFEGNGLSWGVVTGCGEYPSEDVSITGNDFKELLCGVYIFRGINVDIEDNTFKNMKAAVVVETWAENILVKGNTAINATVLVYLCTSVFEDEVTIEDNILSNTEELLIVDSL